MLIIYHDVGGAHSTQVAAAVHLKHLPTDKIPTARELQAIPTFDRAEEKDMGRIRLAGTDEVGNTVYTLARQYTDSITIPAIEDLYSILTGNTDGLMLVNITDQPQANSEADILLTGRHSVRHS